MNKWKIVTACAGCALLIFLFAGLWNGEVLIKKIINTHGPSLTRSPVHVERVHIVLWRGEAQLFDFYLGNPEGFNTPHALKAPSIKLNIKNKASLMGNTIVIDTIEFIQPQIYYEKKWGNDNFKQLIKNVKGDNGKHSKEARSAGGNARKKLIIKDVFVRDAQVNLAISAAVGHTISARLGDIHFKDIGETQGGLPPSEVFKIILSKLYDGITAPAMVRLLNKDMSESIIENDDTKTISELKSTADRLKGLVGR